MAYIRVPVSQTSVSGSRYIYSRCPYCGNYHIYKYNINAEGVGMFSSGSRKTAINSLQKKDDELYRCFNIVHDYSKSEGSFTCPYCNNLQPWSMPYKWSKSKSSRWICGFILLCFTLLMYVFFAIENPAILPVLVIPVIGIGLMLFFKIRNVNRNKKSIEDMKKIPFEYPVYFNRINEAQLVDLLNNNPGLMYAIQNYNS